MYEKHKNWDKDRDNDDQNEDAMAILKAPYNKIKRVCFGIAKEKQRK